MTMTDKNPLKKLSQKDAEKFVEEYLSEHGVIKDMNELKLFSEKFLQDFKIKAEMKGLKLEEDIIIRFSLCNEQRHFKGYGSYSFYIYAK